MAENLCPHTEREPNDKKDAAEQREARDDKNHVKHAPHAHRSLDLYTDLLSSIL